jgi:hypothetical protein
MLVRDNIYNFCLRIIFVLLRVNDDITDYITPRFFILEFAEIFAIFGYCVYLQLIELKFCSLNQNLDKNIIVRGHKESIIIPLGMIHDIETEKNEDNNDDDCSRDINNTDDNSSFL